MATRTLIEKIEALPPDKQAEVQRFVESLAPAEEPLFPQELLHHIRRDHEALARQSGPIDTDDVLRELRDSGGR
jgi:hypothetical protein